MARVRIRQAGPTLLTAAPVTIYTVPTGRKATVKHVHFTNTDVANRKVFLSIGADAVGTRIFDTFNVNTKDVKDHYAYHVLNAGETLQAYADAANVVVIIVSG